MTSNPLPHRGGRKAGSVGKATGIELTILDENGVPQPQGCTGEVCIRIRDGAVNHLNKKRPEESMSIIQALQQST